MDKKIQKMNQPDYKKIYADIIKRRFPEKSIDCKALLQKEELSTLDIITLNKKIFGNSGKDYEIFNQRHRSYKPSSIKYILNYQKKNNLNNTQLALHFKLSRNTIAKWRAIDWLNEK